MNTASTLGEGGEAAPPDLAALSVVALWLPTRDAYRLSTVSHDLLEFVSHPTFLARHLSPMPISLLHDTPDTLIVQPRRGLGYSHVTLVSTNPAERVGANSISTFFSGEGLGMAGSVDFSPKEAARAAAAEAEFFERTMPLLDIAIVAAHGRLLLGRSRGRGRYFVCDPGANRWLALPPPTIPPERDTASGLYYHFDEGSRKLSFKVVLLVRIKRRRVRVETFTSETGTWAAEDLVAQGAARCLGVVSPGIYVGTSFYWQSRALSSDVRYDVSTGRASVVREPPQATGTIGRLGRSLGSAGGRLRMSALDISDSILPEGLEGVHSVWVMDAAAGQPAWERVHEAVVYGLDTPVDFVGASAEFIVVERVHRLLRYDLVSGVKEELADLQDSRRGALYSRFHVFPLFRSYQVAGRDGDEANPVTAERTYPVYRERVESSKNTFKGKIVYEPGRRPALLEDSTDARADALGIDESPAEMSYSYSRAKDGIVKKIKTVERKIQGAGNGKCRKKLGRGVAYLTSVADRLSAAERLEADT